MVYHMSELGEIHFYHYSLMVHWGFGSNYGQKGVVLVWHLFFIESKCFSWIVLEVLRFGKNLNNFLVFR